MAVITSRFLLNKHHLPFKSRVITAVCSLYLGHRSDVIMDDQFLLMKMHWLGLENMFIAAVMHGGGRVAFRNTASHFYILFSVTELFPVLESVWRLHFYEQSHNLVCQKIIVPELGRGGDFPDRLSTNCAYIVRICQRRQFKNSAPVVYALNYFLDCSPSFKDCKRNSGKQSRVEEKGEI